MRRTASEVIRELERRVARLERQSAKRGYRLVAQVKLFQKGADARSDKSTYADYVDLHEAPKKQLTDRWAVESTFDTYGASILKEIGKLQKQAEDFFNAGWEPQNGGFKKLRRDSKVEYEWHISERQSRGEVLNLEYAPKGAVESRLYSTSITLSVRDTKGDSVKSPYVLSSLRALLRLPSLR